jgi:uroporphyrinogen decarboxylase
MRGSSFRAKELSLLNPLGISFDWQVPLPVLRAQVPQKIAIQGNLDPDLLYAPLPVIEKKVKALLDSMRGDPSFIVNLGHGVKPDVPVDAVRCLVETVKKWQ